MLDGLVCVMLMLVIPRHKLPAIANRLSDQEIDTLASQLRNGHSIDEAWNAVRPFSPLPDEFRKIVAQGRTLTSRERFREMVGNDLDDIYGSLVEILKNTDNKASDRVMAAKELLSRGGINADGGDSFAGGVEIVMGGMNESRDTGSGRTIIQSSSETKSLSSEHN